MNEHVFDLSRIVLTALAVPVTWYQILVMLHYHAALSYAGRIRLRPTWWATNATILIVQTLFILVWVVTWT